MTPREGLKKTKLERRVSSEKIPGTLAGTVVGCAECHTLNAGKHKDSFEHNGFQVHVVVTPEDCATCHGKEVQQYGQNLMAKAYGNLMNNPVYRQLVEDINGTAVFKENKLILTKPDSETNADSCLFCHGTVVEVKGLEETGDRPGRNEFSGPDRLAQSGGGPGQPRRQPGFLRGLPHPPRLFHRGGPQTLYLLQMPQGSGCAGLSGVRGEQTRQPARLARTKTGISKSVPWKVGKDFTAPTCAACHVSLIMGDGAGRWPKGPTG